MNSRHRINSLVDPHFGMDGSYNAYFNSVINDYVLKLSVVNRLTWYSCIPVESISITVNHGYVTLTGVVQYMYQKIITASMIQNIKGLKGIINDIKVLNS